MKTKEGRLKRDGKNHDYLLVMLCINTREGGTKVTTPRRIGDRYRFSQKCRLVPPTEAFDRAGNASIVRFAVNYKSRMG